MKNNTFKLALGYGLMIWMAVRFWANIFDGVVFGSEYNSLRFWLRLIASILLFYFGLTIVKKAKKNDSK